MRNGKGLEFPEGWGGGKGSRIREADSDDRGFPLKSSSVKTVEMYEM
jgi:hypothetical protein